MKVVLQVLKDERAMLTELMASGNYGHLEEYVHKLDDKIAILEAQFKGEPDGR